MNPAMAYSVVLRQGSSEETRLKACGNHNFALGYALNIDRDYHPTTWEAVKGTKPEKKYRETLIIPKSMSYSRARKKSLLL